MLAVSNTSIEQQRINQRIEAGQQRCDELERQLNKAQQAQEKLHTDAAKYQLAREIFDKLEQLKELGGAGLVWGIEDSEQQLQERFSALQTKLVSYDEKILEQQQQQEQIKQELHRAQTDLAILTEQIYFLQEEEEERQQEFVIERDMGVIPYRPMVMPWSGVRQDENRFRNILLISVLLSVLLGFLFPLWQLPIPDRDEVVEIPERLALLIEKKPPPPPPVEKEQVIEEKQAKEKKPKPKAEEVKVARQKAEKSGLLAFKDNFAELMENSVEAKLGAQAKVSNKGQNASQTDRSMVVANLDASSSGINTSSLSRNVGDAGSNIGDVAFSRVESTIGSEFGGEERPLSEGVEASRTDEEIQIVFDRYKSALYRIYNRELRNNSTLRGKIVLRITIEPDGKVANCKLESSDMQAPALEAKIVARVKMINFGPKEGVPPVTILYPIDFLPAS